MKKLLFITALLLIQHPIYSQFGGVKVTTSEDAFEGTKTVLMDGNKVKVDGVTQSSILKGILGLASGNVRISQIKTELNLEQFQKADGTADHFIIVSIEIKDDARFFIDKGESLVLMVDGKRMAFKTKGEFNSEYNVRYHNSKTNARYAITPAQLKTIVKAETVKFRIINGGFMEREEETRDKEGSYFEGAFDEDNLKAWKDFYQTYTITQS